MEASKPKIPLALVFSVKDIAVPITVKRNISSRRCVFITVRN